MSADEVLAMLIEARRWAVMDDSERCYDPHEIPREKWNPEFADFMNRLDAMIVKLGGADQCASVTN